MKKILGQMNKKMAGILCAVVALAVVTVGGLYVWSIWDEIGIEKMPTEDVYSYVNEAAKTADVDKGFAIDGVFDEKAYAGSEWLYLHNNNGASTVDVKATDYFGEKGVYFAFDVDESTPIYVNPDRENYVNSGLELYLAPSSVQNMNSNEVFEIDLLPNGTVAMKQRTKYSFIDATTTNDKMAVLGATTKGGELNTEDCHGYTMEFFIPWEYFEWLGIDSEAIKKGGFSLNIAHITSYNETGTDVNTDRYWYSFAQQAGGDGWDNIPKYFQFDKNGAKGVVPVTKAKESHCKITGDATVLPGLKAHVTVTPDEGYTVTSITSNKEELIKDVSYNQDGSIDLTLRGVDEGLEIAAEAAKAESGNHTLTANVSLKRMGTKDSLADAEVVCKGPDGLLPVEMDGNGSFTIEDAKEGYYTITAQKVGYEKVTRTILLNKDTETNIGLEYPVFTTEEGNCWNTEDANDGVLHKAGARGVILSTDSYNKFSLEANFRYDAELAKASEDNDYVQQRMGFRVKFSNDTYWHPDVMFENDEYKVTYGKLMGDQSLFNWTTAYVLNDAEIAKYKSKEGINVKIVRDGQYVNVYVEGSLVAIEDLGAEYRSCTAQVGFESYMANNGWIDIPYQLSTDNVKIVKDYIFEHSDQFNTTRQFQGEISLDNGGYGIARFVKSYKDINLAIQVKDDPDAEGDVRNDIFFEFDNGKKVSFGINTEKDGYVHLQSVKDDDNSLFPWWDLGTLDEDTLKLYQSKEGVEFRVIRRGTEFSLIVNGKLVNVLDLSEYITEDTSAKVSIRHWGDDEIKVVIPFRVSDKITDEEYSKLTNTIFYKSNGFDISKQFEGSISIPKGGWAQTTFLQKYKEIDLTLTVKDDPSAEEDVRNDVLFTFDNGRKVSFGITTEGSGYVHVQSVKDGEESLLPWTDHGCLYGDALKLYQSKTGVKLRIVRKDTEFLILVNDEIVNVVDLSGYISADTKAEVTIRHWGDKDTEIVVPFTVSGQVSKSEYKQLRNTVFVRNENFDISKQLDGVITLPKGGYGKTVFLKKFGDIDLAIRARDLPDGEGSARNDIQFVFDNGKKVSFGITTEKDGYTHIQSFKDDANSVYPWQDHGALTGDYLKLYKSTTGVRFRVVRRGTEFMLLVNEELINIVDMSDYIAEDTQAQVAIRHFDDDGVKVEMSYQVEAGISDAAYQKIKSTVFYRNEGFDLSKQQDGVVAIPGGGKAKASFVKKYADMDLTITARDYADGKEGPRTDVLFEFENGRKISFGINTESDGYVHVQTMNDDLMQWKDHGALTEKEIEKYTGKDGVKLHIIRKDTEISVYIGSRLVSTVDLSKYIKADTRANIVLRHYDDNGADVEIPFVMNENRIKTILQINQTANGKLSTGKESYILGQPVDLVAEPDEGYRFAGVKINGRTIEVQGNGYTFVAEDTKYVIEPIFKERIFEENDKWDLTGQNENTVSLPADHKDNYNALQFYGSFTTADVTLNVKDDPDGTGSVRNDILFTFADGRSVSFGITTEESGYVHLQSVGGGENNLLPWRDHGALSDTAKALYQSRTGVKLRVIRKDVVSGNETRVMFYLLVNEEVVNVVDMSEYIEAGTEATITFRHWGDNGVEVSVPFEISHSVDDTEFDKINNTIFIKNNGWDLSGQFDGVLSIANGGKAQASFRRTYTDMDLALTVRDYADGTGGPRNDVLFTFANGRKVSFGINTEADGYVHIQTMNDDLMQWKNHGRLNDSEIAKYTGDSGVKFRIVREGTVFNLYIGSRRVNSVDLAEYIEADTTAEITLRHYDDNGAKVEMPFEMKGTAAQVNINIEAAEHGSVKTDKAAYYQDELVTLTGEPEEGYRLAAVIINGTEVAVQGDRYEFVTFDESYTIVPVFKERIFVDADGWDVTGQNDGTVSVTEKHDWLQFYQKYTDTDITVTAKDDPNGNGIARTDVLFKFDDGNAIDFGIASVDNEIRVQSMNDSMAPYAWKSHYTLTEEEVRQFNGEGIDLRIVRSGSVMSLYVGGKYVTEIDLTDKIAADTAATIFIRHYDDDNVIVEIPFRISSTLEKADITVTTEHGAVDTRKLYMAGDEVVLTPAADEGYMLKSLTISKDGVALDNVTVENGSYHFTAEAGEYSVEAVFAEKVIASSDKWDVSDQLNGNLLLPGGDWATATLAGTYGNVDVDLVVRDYNKQNGGPRYDVLFEFDNDKKVSFGIVTEDSGYLHLQSMGTEGFIGAPDWIDRGVLNDSEKALYQSESGIQLRIERKGTSFNLYLGDRLVKTVSLSNEISADTRATISIRHWGDNGANVVLPFKVTNTADNVTLKVTAEHGSLQNKAEYFVGDEIVLTPKADDGYLFKSLSVDGVNVSLTDGSYKFTAERGQYEVKAVFVERVFNDADGWDTSNQVNGTITKVNGGYGVISFYKQYTDADITVTAKDDPNGKDIARTDVLFKFDDGKAIDFGIASVENEIRVQSMEDSMEPYKWMSHYTLTEEEVSQFNGEGIDLQIVRSGSVMSLYVGGKYVKEIDLTDKIAADTAATVFIRHYDDDNVNIEIPFSISVPASQSLDTEDAEAIVVEEDTEIPEEEVPEESTESANDQKKSDADKKDSVKKEDIKESDSEMVEETEETEDSEEDEDSKDSKDKKKEDPVAVKPEDKKEKTDSDTESEEIE